MYTQHSSGRLPNLISPLDYIKGGIGLLYVYSRDSSLCVLPSQVIDVHDESVCVGSYHLPDLLLIESLVILGVGVVRVTPYWHLLTSSSKNSRYSLWNSLNSWSVSMGVAIVRGI